MRAAAYIVHLPRAAKRRPRVDALMAGLPLPASVVEAVDGSALPPAGIEAVLRRDLHTPRYPFDLLPGEIGCFLSHRKAWQAMLDEGLDAALIVEDDVEPIGETFDRVLDFALAHMGPADYIRFPYRERTDGGPVVASGDGVRLMRPAHVGFGTQMQLVGRDAAALLLAATRTFDRPIDAMIQMRWLIDIRVLAARPTAIRQVAHLLGGTVVQKKSKPFGEVLGREVRRAVYRASVRTLSFMR
jgi:GR25 family glycosyltransferase involved in LPS biosynthesis